MALLAEEVVEEWLNRQGYFTIRGIRIGVDEIDILAIKPQEDGTMDCRHVEVQASINPISYISRVPKELQKKHGIKPNSAKEREESVLTTGVKEWVDKKFNKKKKSNLRKKMYDGDWSFELVINNVKYSHEVELIKNEGITVHYLKDVVKVMLDNEYDIKSASGADLVNLMLLGKGSN